MRRLSEIIVEGDYMRFLFYEIAFIFFLLLLPSLLLTQDSLHLVGTITGELGARITDVNGIGDVNGDVYEDFIVTAKDKTVRLYLGANNTILTPPIILHYPGKDSLIGSFGGGAGAGDINGDGYNDFVIKGKFGDWGWSPKGKVFVYYGGSDIDTIPEYEIYEPWVQDWFGESIEGVGDINKDGFDDFLIGSSYNWSNGKGRAYLFFGGDTISYQRSVSFVDTAAISQSVDSFFGSSLANIGDINGDGFEDIAIMAGYDPIGYMEKVYVYYGGTIVDAIPDTVINRYDAEYFGEVKRMGDINKDGMIDFCITGMITLYINTNRDSIIKVKGFSFNSGIETDCDINNDGFSDFVTGKIGYWNHDSVMVGAAFVYLSGETIDTVYKYKFEGENKWDEFGRIITTADINGDGYDELFILASNYPDYNNPLGKIYIYSYKNLTQVEVGRETIPDKFILYQNYPNPFNPTTTIRYTLKTYNFTSLQVYDILGRKIATLVDRMQQQGEHMVNFNASGLSSGVYFYRLKSGNFVTQKSMLLLK